MNRDRPLRNKLRKFLFELSYHDEELVQNLLSSTPVAVFVVRSCGRVAGETVLRSPSSCSMHPGSGGVFQPLDFPRSNRPRRTRGIHLSASKRRRNRSPRPDEDLPLVLAPFPIARTSSSSLSGRVFRFLPFAFRSFLFARGFEPGRSSLSKGDRFLSKGTLDVRLGAWRTASAEPRTLAT